MLSGKTFEGTDISDLQTLAINVAIAVLVRYVLRVSASSCYS